MSTRRTVRSLAALAATFGLAVSGCTHSAKPKPLPSPTTTPSRSAPASPAPPTLPPAANGTSTASAKAFVRYWVRVLNYSGPAGDSEPVRRLSSEGCIDCDAIGDYIDKITGEGGTIKGRGWTVKRIRLIDRDGPREAVLDALVQVSKQSVVAAKGKTATTFPGGKRLKTFWLKRTDSAWQVTRLDQSE